MSSLRSATPTKLRARQHRPAMTRVRHLQQVSLGDHILAGNNACGDRSRLRLEWLTQALHQLDRNTLECQPVHSLAIPGPQEPKGGLAKPPGPFEHRVEYGREIAG